MEKDHSQDDGDERMVPVGKEPSSAQRQDAGDENLMISSDEPPKNTSQQFALWLKVIEKLGDTKKDEGQLSKQFISDEEEKPADRISNIGMEEQKDDVDHGGELQNAVREFEGNQPQQKAAAQGSDMREESSDDDSSTSARDDDEDYEARVQNVADDASEDDEMHEVVGSDESENNSDSEDEQVEESDNPHHDGMGSTQDMNDPKSGDASQFDQWMQAIQHLEECESQQKEKPAATNSKAFQQDIHFDPAATQVKLNSILTASA